MERTNECTDSEGNGQSGSATTDPATRRVDYAGPSTRSSWNIFKRAVSGVSGVNGEGGRD